MTAVKAEWPSAGVRVFERARKSACEVRERAFYFRIHIYSYRKSCMHETRKGLPSQIWLITQKARPYSSRRSLLVNGKADLGLHTFSAVPLHRSTQARYNQFQ